MLLISATNDANIGIMLHRLLSRTICCL